MPVPQQYRYPGHEERHHEQLGWDPKHPGNLAHPGEISTGEAPEYERREKREAKEEDGEAVGGCQQDDRPASPAPVCELQGEMEKEDPHQTPAERGDTPPGEAGSGRRGCSLYKLAERPGREADGDEQEELVGAQAGIAGEYVEPYGEVRDHRQQRYVFEEFVQGIPPLVGQMFSRPPPAR